MTGDATADQPCVQFLQEYLPRIGLRWPGFRKVRRQVCKRLGRRVRELGLPDLSAYRGYLEEHPEEWEVFDGFCRITISRLCRDRGIFDRLGREVLPALAAGAGYERALRAWSAGCASGEEVYTLRLLWDLTLQPRWPGISLSILGTDIDPQVLQRASRACYERGSLREMPPDWLGLAFERSGDEWCVRQEHRHGIELRQQDLRSEMPEGPFHLILCRNLAFTYFDEPRQREIAHGLLDRLVPGGFLVVGAHESLPSDLHGVHLVGGRGIYRKDAAG